MMLQRILLSFAITVAGVLAGSKCPPREDIYPCVCINQKLNGRRQLNTAVVCSGLEKTAVLSAIIPALKDMDIDHFVMYDSFWKAPKELDANGKSQSALPNDWLTLTTIKEFEVLDSTLSDCFACHWSFMCRNNVTTSFKVVNSSSSDKICSLCQLDLLTNLPWMGCMEKLQHFQFSHGGLKALRRDFLPLALPELKTLDLSHNQISKIDSNVFRHVPNIVSLDLSHNAIDSITHQAFGLRTKLEYFDISYNALKTLGHELIPVMPKIKSLNFSYNQITNFTNTEWKRSPRSLHTIDLRGNSITCDCEIMFVNSTFSVGTHILGNCARPDNYKGSRLRTASRHLSESCTRNGETWQRL